MITLNKLSKKPGIFNFSGCRKMRATLTLILMVMALALPVNIMADDIFAELASMPNVESSYISHRFAHNKKNWRSASGQHSMNLAAGFSSLFSYQCFSKDAVDKAKSILDSYLKKNPDMEVVMKTRQNISEYVIYEKFGSDGKLYQMIIWNLDSPQICEIVVVDWKDGLEPSHSDNSNNFEIDNFDVIFGEYKQPLNNLKLRPIL